MRAENAPPPSIRDRIRRRWLPGGLLTLAVLLIFSALASISSVRKHNHEIALEGARNIARIIVLTRQWNAEHGGVYVPSTEASPPNPYLDAKRREVTTEDGRKLALINPAYMTRQLAELAERSGSLHIHITSLRPIRPENRANDWETKALQQFENGTREWFGEESREGMPVLRYMMPLIVNQNCMSCHADQGYKIGDVRGGIAVTLNYAPIAAALKREMIRIALTHLAFFVVGALALYLLLETLHQRWSALEVAQQELEQTRNKLIQSEKLATLGRLVGGFAQEIDVPVSEAMKSLRQMENTSQHLDVMLNKATYGQADIHPLLDAIKAEQHQALTQLRRSALLIEHFRRTSFDQNTNISRSFLLSEAISDVLSSMSHTLKHAPVNIQVACPATLVVQGPPGTYEYVLTNLLLNRIRYGFPETSWRGNILIVAEVSANGTELMLRLSDDGTGIALERLDRLFDPEIIGEESDNSRLSLYLVRMVVNRELGGSLRCESDRDKGTHFFIQCPLHIASPQERVNIRFS